MAEELTQNAQGEWKLKVSHDKRGINLSIPVELTYDEITKQINVTDTTKEYMTGWFTDVGVAINPSEIKKSPTAYTKDYVKYKITYKFDEIHPYDGSGDGGGDGGGGDDDDPGHIVGISLAVVPASVGAAGGDNVAVLQVRSTTAWTISKSAGFATLSQTAGTGDADIEISLTKYTDTTEDRTVSFTGKTSGSVQKTSTATLTQRKASDEEPRISLSVSPSTISSAGGNNVVILDVQSNTSWTITKNKSFVTLGQTAGTGNAQINVSVEENTDSSNNRKVTFTGKTTGSDQRTATAELTQEKASGSIEPVYSLVVSVAEGYDTTIDSEGTTKLIATYYDGLGGSTAVTDMAEWLIITGAGYINLDATTNPVTVTGRGNATDHSQQTKVMARYSNLSDDIEIIVLQNPEIPPYISLEDEDDISRFLDIVCTGLSPAYEIGVSSNVAWRARLTDIDDDYWLHVSYNATTVTVSIDANVDPYSGEGGEPRTSSFIIEAVNPDLEIQPITVQISQASCPDRINVPDKDAFVFSCDGPASYTRTIEAWDDVEWRIEPVYGEYQTEDWFSVSPLTGVGNGSFTVTILTDNYDNRNRASGHLYFYTGSPETRVDWEVDVKQEPTPFFEVTGTTAHFSSEGGNGATIRVETNMPITAETTESWIKELTVGNNVRVVGGKSYTEVTFNVDENTSRESGRNGDIVITSLYDGPCGSLGSATVSVTQDASTATTATFIKIRKITEPSTTWHQEVEYGINEADASTKYMDFILWADGKCKLTNLTKDFVTDVQVLDVNGSIEIDITDGTPFDLIGTGRFRVVYGDAFIGSEKSLSLRFEVNEPGAIVGSDEKVTLELTQERDYPIGVTGVSIENVGPHIVPNTTDGPGSSCDWNLTEMWVQIYAETLYKSGYRTHSSEAIDNYIKREGNNTGVDEEILTLEVLNNPSTGTKYCIILPDELHGGNYHPTYDYPFKIQFSPNSGETQTSDPWADGFRRDVIFKLTYNDEDGNTAEQTFTVRVPYCYVAPGTQNVYLVDGGNYVDEMTLNPGVDTTVTIQVTGLTNGETKLSFDCDESITSSILTDFEVQNVSFDASSPLNEWTADSDSATISFTRKSRDEFRFDIICNRTGYEEKILNVWFDVWE
jgi:hypothetical protein